MDAYLFNEKEGLRIAAEIERRGLGFYEHARRVTKSSAVKALLDDLIEDERGHLNEFARLSEAHPGGGEYDMETNIYLSAIAADIVFSGGLSALAEGDGLESTISILKYSIASEKDSILFYQALIEKIAGEDTRNVFREIIRQEMVHLSRLQAQLIGEESK